MAETRSKAKAKGLKGDEDTKGNFISALANKYKPLRSYNDYGRDQYSPTSKKFKNIINESYDGKKLITQSQPFYLSTNHSELAANGSRIDETYLEREENPLIVECSDEDKCSLSTETNDKNVAGGIKTDKQNTKLDGDNMPSVNEEEEMAELKSVNNVFHVSPLQNDNIKNGGIFIRQSLEKKSSQEHEDEIQVHFESDTVASPTSNPASCSVPKNSPGFEKSPACSCSIKLIRQHDNLVKISEELKTINNIIENIKKELEKHTK